MSFSQFMKELQGSRVEGELIKTVLYSLLTSSVILVLLYFFSFRFLNDFFTLQGYYLFFAVLSYAFLVPVIRHIRAYKEFPCMTGMMLGMTTGMIAGFLAGFYIGATNGMFYGSVFGMAAGIFVGVWMGNCCGIMGVLEGIMAGFMGALMGGMTALMLLNDHLHAATVIIFLITTVMLFLLHYLIYHEMAQQQRQRMEDQILTLTLSALLTLATAWMMVWGPRSFWFT